MICSPENIAIDPTISGNLQGLKSVRTEYQFELSNLPVVMAQFPVKRLSEQVAESLQHAGITTGEKSSAVLTIGIAVQPSLIPQLGGMAALYAVEVAIRELVLLPRTANDLTSKQNYRSVDTWRTKPITGILLPKTSYADASALLYAAVLQQIERLLLSWRDDQNFSQKPRNDSEPEDDPTPPVDPTDPKIKKVKEKLEQLLSTLAQGNEGNAKLEKFDVDGSRVDFAAKIRHHHTTKVIGQKVTVYDVSTRASGAFDLAKPETLKVKVCVDKPSFLGGGEICQELSGIADVL
jgi:hypothetical protein